jgi:choline monooxygenase
VRGTLPWAWYADPEILRREQERIFRSAWSYVGHTGELAARGDYVAREIGLTPVVVVHDGDGLRAFVNVCPHRAHQVAAGAGRRETLQCGYHAWTYALDGKLRSAPRSDSEPGFDKDSISLAPAQVDTIGPLVFANADPEAPPLADTVGRLPDLLREHGVELGSLAFRLRSHSSVEANWKLVCENYLECYHCPVAHPGFSKVVDVSPDAYRLSADGRVCSQFGPARDGGADSHFHFIYPNVGLNVFPGAPNLSIGPMNPTSSNRTVRFLDYFFPDGTEERWVDELLELDEQVGAEDRQLVENVQRGLDAGVLEAGHLLEESEQLVVRFQELTREHLADPE